MPDREYVNVFEDVHKKVKAFKDRLRVANKGYADLCEDKVLQDSKEMEIADKESSNLN